MFESTPPSSPTHFFPTPDLPTSSPSFLITSSTLLFNTGGETILSTVSSSRSLFSDPNVFGSDAFRYQPLGEFANSNPFQQHNPTNFGPQHFQAHAEAPQAERKENLSQDEEDYLSHDDDPAFEAKEQTTDREDSQKETEKSYVALPYFKRSSNAGKFQQFCTPFPAIPGLTNARKSNDRDSGKAPKKSSSFYGKALTHNTNFLRQSGNAMCPQIPISFANSKCKNYLSFYRTIFKRLHPTTGNPEVPVTDRLLTSDEMRMWDLTSVPCHDPNITFVSPVQWPLPKKT